MSIATAIYSASIYSGGSWVDVTSSILAISGSAEASQSSDNALAFGDFSDTRIAVVAALALQSYTWGRTPFKVTFTVNGTAAEAFHGVITERERTLSDLTYTCEGFAALLRDTKVYSPLFYRRPVATKTTAASVEDPSNIAYVAGPLNWLMWQAGGRPAEQDYVYPSAAFYYSFDFALLAPDWAWLAGEDGWSEGLKMVQAAGGQLYQGPDGIIHYRNPYAIADGSVGAFAYTLSSFADLREQQSSRHVATQFTVPFIPRALRPIQDVAEDTTPRFIPAGEQAIFSVEPKWPLYTLDTQSGLVRAPLDGSSISDLRSEDLTIVTALDAAATQGVDYFCSVVFAAQRLAVTITNLSTWPIAIYKVKLRGQPILPDEAGSVTVGSGTVAKTAAEGNPYVQTRQHAERLASLYLAFYGAAHPLRSVSGLLFNPALTIGALGTLTALDLSAVAHVVSAIRHSETGVKMDVDLVEIAGLHALSEFYIIGTDYSAASSKILGY